jgi:hypothetical protein
MADFLSDDWSGTCCYCGGKMTRADFEQQEGIAVGGAEGVVVLHARHVINRREYHEAVYKMAVAYAALLHGRLGT